MTDKNLDLFDVSSMDQINTVSPQWMVEKAQEIVDESIRRKDVEYAMNGIYQLTQVSQLAGIGLAKILYDIYANWEVFGIDEYFVDYVYRRVGKHRHTVERYIRIWKMFAKHVVPAEYEKEIMSISLQHQFPIANALEQGWQFKEQDWKRIAHAPDGASIKKIVHEIKREPERANNLRLEVDRVGNIWAYPGQQERKFVGTLELDNDNEIVRRAVKRITTRSGILEQ